MQGPMTMAITLWNQAPSNAAPSGDQYTTETGDAYVTEGGTDPYVPES